MNKLKSIFPLLLALVLVSVSFTPGTTYAKESPDSILFGSRQIEAEVRKAVGKPAGDIYMSDVEGITSITLNSTADADVLGRVIDLTGLELLPALTELNINIMHDGSIKNIELLRKLPNLTALHIQQLQPTYYTLKNLNIFSSLKNLKELSLNNFKGLNITGLSEFPKLQKLSLGYCGIKDINPLVQLADLEKLNLTGNDIEDISPLQELIKITALYLDGNIIKDYTPISNNYVNYADKDFILEKDADGRLTKKDIEYADRVTFINRDTEAMVRALLNKPAGYLGKAELKSIKSLEMSVYNAINPVEYVSYYDLQDFSKLTGLESLSITFNKSTDSTNLDALGKLTNLAELSISPYSEGLTDISAFGTLVNLKQFNVTYINTKENLNTLTKLTKLEKLRWLGDDLKPLIGLKELKELTVSGNTQDFSVLNKLPKLETLHIDAYTVPKLASLKSCTNIRSLDINYIPLSDISFLSGMTKLEKLQIVHGGLKSINTLSKLHNLKELNLKDNAISDITPLAQLKKLEVLNLSYNKVSNLNALKSLPRLKELDFGGNPIKDISALSQLKTLNSLTMHDNYVNSLKPLEGLKALKELTIFRCSISNISYFAAMTELEKLSLVSNSINDISPLKGMTKMKYLDLSGNKIEGISALKDMKQIIRLNICYNKINDITPLSGLSGLEMLDLRFNNFTDASSILSMTRMEELSLDGNPIKDYTALQTFKNNTRTYVTGLNRPGYVFGDAVKTDTAAYWNENAIPCIRIGESYAIALEDLNKYGYDAVWVKVNGDDTARWRIDRNSAKPIQAINVVINPNEKGSQLGKAMYAINLGFWENKPITIVGVNSKAYVMVNELEQYGFYVVLDKDRNVLNISQWERN